MEHTVFIRRDKSREVYWKLHRQLNFNNIAIDPDTVEVRYSFNVFTWDFLDQFYEQIQGKYEA